MTEDQAGETGRMITFGEAAERGDFIQLEHRTPADHVDPLAGFDPDDALEKMREAAIPRSDDLARLFRRLDHWLIAGERMPAEWAHPDPGVIAERSFRNQPRRTSRQERRRGAR